MSNQSLGKAGEDLAVNYLETHGYLIVDRNVTLCRGEIDIVARKHRTTVFVEVKTRASNAFGSPAEAVTPAKARSLARAANEYIHQNDKQHSSFRFDVISILLPPGGDPEIELIENALEIGDIT